MRPLFLLLGAFSLLSCGLEDIKYLENPPVPGPTSQGRDLQGLLYFSVPASYFKDSNGDPTGLIGFDLYYKIQSAPTGTKSNIALDDEKLRAAAPNTPLELVSLGYTPAYSYTLTGANLSLPSMPLDSGDQTKDLSFVLDFSKFVLGATTQDEKKNQTAFLRVYETADFDLQNLTENQLYKYEIRRGVKFTATEGEFRTFSELFDPEKAAKGALEAGALTPLNGTTVEITFYVVAVGVDPSNILNSLESEPVPLGTLGLNATFILK